MLADKALKVFAPFTNCQFCSPFAEDHGEHGSFDSVDDLPLCAWVEVWVLLEGDVAAGCCDAQDFVVFDGRVLVDFPIFAQAADADTLRV